MPAPSNSFKAALRQNKVQIGCWLGMGSAYSAEMAATAGFDWLLIDVEHAPNDLRSVMGQLQVIDASPSHPVVRLPVGKDWLIKQYLDLGAQSLLIPMVESAEQAAQLVKAVRYSPEGSRGVGAALARASRFSTIPDYLATADEEICLLVQVESRAGLDALDDMLAVEGIDGVFLGPSDLAADMGLLGKPSDPMVVEAVADAIGRIREAGKGAGVLTSDEQFLRACFDKGATFVAVGIDVTIFVGAMKNAAKRGKSVAGS